MPPEDPVDWTVDQVVDFLCHDPYTPWSQSAAPPPRPDPATFGEALQSNMINGETLLYDVDKQTLRDELGLTKVGHWSSILRAIRYLQQISQKYQNPRLQSTTPFEQSPIVPYPEPPRAESISYNDRQTTHPSSTTSSHRENTDEKPSLSPLPRIRPHEHYAFDQQGRKRRKLELQTTPQVTVNQKAAENEDKQELEKKDWYIGPGKISPSGLFYPVLPDDDDADDAFVICSPKFPTAQRLFVKKCLQHFYQQRPIDLGSDSGSRQWAVVPYSPSTLNGSRGRRKSQVVLDRSLMLDNGQNNCFTLYSSNGKGGKVTVRQEDIKERPQLSERDFTQHENQAVILNSSDFFSFIARKYGAQENEEAYPLYGDSCSEGEYDEDTLNEMDEDIQSNTQGRKERLSLIEVDSIIAECINKMEEEWHQKRKPTQEPKARGIWLSARKRKSVNERIKFCSREVPSLEKRLKKFQDAIRKNEWSSKEELMKQCQSMEQTIYAIQSRKWHISVLTQSECPPKVASTPKRRSAPKARPSNDDEESLDSGSNDEFGGFIEESADEDLVAGDAVANGIRQALSPEKPQDRLVAAHAQSSLSLDEDAFVGDAMQGAEDSGLDLHQIHQTEQTPIRTPSLPEIEIPWIPSPERPPAPENVSTLQCIDLTRETPPLEGDDDLSIKTPPLNPSVPNVPNTADNMIKGERHMSISPGPELEPNVSEHVGITRKETPRIETPGKEISHEETPHNKAPHKETPHKETSRKDNHRKETSGKETPRKGTPHKDNNKPRNGDAKRQRIDFAEVSRMSWETLEEIRDRKKILAKLVKGLPDDERENMTQRIPNFVTGLLEMYVKRALKCFANGRQEVNGIDSRDMRLVTRTASLYISWFNCRHYGGQGIPRKDVTRTIGDLGNGFKKFDNYLIQCLVDFDRWVKDERAGAGYREASGIDDEGPEPSSSNPHKKRKREVKESQQVKENHQTAQHRVAIQDEQRRRLERKMESMGYSNDDSEHKAVSFGNPTIYLDPHIGRRIMAHQLRGIQFMWRELVEDENREGCVLAHTMGLGKTMQVVSLLLTISAAAGSTNVDIRKQVPECFHRSQTLVLCPPALIDNWYEEFLMWSPRDSKIGPLRKITSSDTVSVRLGELFAWDEEGGVLIVGYDIFRSWVQNNTASKSKPLSDDEHQRTKKCLLNGPNIIVADEAHEMKNQRSQISSATSEFRSKSRIALTGTPLSNELNDLYSMVNWVSPGYLGTPVEFRANYVEPIAEGLFTESSYQERRKCLVKLQVLKEILNPKINRADISVIEGSLPPKVEFVITVPMTDLQKAAYNSYVEPILQAKGDVGYARILSWLQTLSLCCNHPACFRDKLIGQANSAATLRNNAAKLKEKTNEVDGADQGSVDESNKEIVAQASLPETIVADQERYFSAIPDVSDCNFSYRMQLLDRIIAESVKAGDKVLVFSHSIPTLNYIGRMLEVSRHRYCRLDGKTPVNNRQHETKRFNTVNSEQVYLISTTAGGLGLNIVGANRVVIFDFQFNPTNEEQAVGRAYRLGQRKPVFVYRFVAGGTFEEIKYNKAIFKAQLAFRVVDKKNPIRSASRSLRSYIFPVKQVERQNVSEYIGKDPLVLDKIIRDDVEGAICKITLTETFQKEDNDKLTEEEKLRVQQTIADEHLKRTDPVAFENLLRQRLEEEAKRMSAMMSNVGGSYHYGYQPHNPRPSYDHYVPPVPEYDSRYIRRPYDSVGATPRPPYVPTSGQQEPPIPATANSGPPSIPDTAHSSGPPALAPDTSVNQFSSMSTEPLISFALPKGPGVNELSLNSGGAS